MSVSYPFATSGGGGGGGGITNSAGANVVMKSDGANAIASKIADDASKTTISEKLVASGAISFSPSATDGGNAGDAGVWLLKTANGEIFQRYTPIGPMVSTDAYTIACVGTASTAIESGAFQTFITTTFDTTLHGSQAIGFLANVSASRAVGANLVTNYGIIVNASGGDTNYSYFSLNGVMRNDGGADFSGGGVVSLGSAVASFHLPGSTSAVADIGIGYIGGTDGLAIHTKNTVPASTLSGVGVFLDTTVEAAVRGGLVIQRGPGGVSSGNSAGVVIAAGAGFPFTTSAANELSIYSQNNAPIVFGGDSTGYVKGMTLETTNELRVANRIQIGTLGAASGGGARWNVGSGSPNGVLAGYVGDYYSNTAGGAGTTFYVKESGAGTNTGWVAK